MGPIVVTPDRSRHELGGGAPHTTNNRMELTAVIEALRHVGAAPRPVAVHTDSSYVIRGIRGVDPQLAAPRLAYRGPVPTS